MYDDFNKDLYVPVLRRDKSGKEYFEYSANMQEILMANRKKTCELVKNGMVQQIDDDRDLYYQNCYAYALGFVAKAWYGPGIFSKQSLDDDLSETKVLMDNVEEDLKIFKINYRRVKNEEDKNVNEGEYLIKVFAVSKDCNTTEDYHFIRQDPKSKLWFHKMGKLQPELFYDGKEKTDFFIKEEAGKKFHYVEAGYFVISE